jgi:hypothetical protein
VNKAKWFAVVRIWNKDPSQTQVLEYCSSIEEGRELIKKEKKDVGQYRGETFAYDVYTWSDEL